MNSTPFTRIDSPRGWRRLPRHLLLSLLPWIACWVSVPLAAQNEGEGAFGEAIEVRVVNLEVVVTADGRRVTGLGPDDFVITVDGEPVTIEFFTEVREGRAVAAPEESETASLPALSTGELVGTSYLVFLDEYFSEPLERDRWVDSLVDQLPLLRPEDRMAVVAYDGDRVEMLSTWSQSTTDLERVLQRAKERLAYGHQRRDEIRTFDLARTIRARDDLLLADGRPSAGDGSFEPPQIDERQEIARLTDQVQGAVRAASSALRSFAAPPGRKVLLLAAGGWPNRPARWVTDTRASTGIEEEFPSGDTLYGPLIETANRLSYTIYSVDVPGLSSVRGTSGAGTAGIDLPRGLLSDRAVDELARRQQRQRLDRNEEEDAALDLIARETGGRSFLNADSLDALARVVEDTRSYYWLGFTPDWQGDDAEHQIVVEPRRRDFAVRSRQSYSDLSRQTEVSMMAESALLFGSPPTAAPLAVEFGPPTKAGFGKVSVPLWITIPLSEVTFLPVQGGFYAEMELHIAVRDEKGDTVEVPVLPINVQGRAAPRPGQNKFFETTITLRKRKHEVVVSLHDRLSGEVLSTRLEFDPARVDPELRRE